MDTELSTHGPRLAVETPFEIFPGVAAPCGKTNVTLEPKNIKVGPYLPTLCVVNVFVVSPERDREETGEQRDDGRASTQTTPTQITLA